MSRLLEIEVFVNVAERGSFAAAAAALGLSSSYASKLVSRLEQRLGVRLLHRTTRRHTLTTQGERYLADCQEALGLLDRSDARVLEAAEVVRGELRVTAATGLGLGLLAEVFNRFALAHPEVRLSVAYLDRFVDLVGERFDLAVRVGELPDSGLHARRVGAYPRRLVASPALTTSLGPLLHPDALRGAPAVVYSGDARPSEWTLRSGEQSITVPVERRAESNSGRAVALAAAAGLGVAFLPSFHTCDLERSGRLVRLLPDWGASVPVHVVFPTARQLPLRVRLLIDHVVAEMAAVAES